MSYLDDHQILPMLMPERQTLSRREMFKQFSCTATLTKAITVATRSQQRHPLAQMVVVAVEDFYAVFNQKAGSRFDVLRAYPVVFTAPCN